MNVCVTGYMQTRFSDWFYKETLETLFRRGRLGNVCAPQAANAPVRERTLVLPNARMAAWRAWSSSFGRLMVGGLRGPDKTALSYGCLAPQ